MMNNDDDKDDTSPPPEMSELVATVAVASESAVVASSAAASAAAREEEEDEPNTTAVVDTVTDLVKHMLNLGDALKCPICYGTMQDPVCLEICMHAFCRPCILQTLKETRKNQCPLCRKKANRRSFLDCPELKKLAEHYKKALPSFGLVGAEYSADVQMTQFEVLPGVNEDDDSDSDDDCTQNGTDLEDTHELWQVSLTMQRALQEGMDAPVSVPQPEQKHVHGHPPNSESARRASAIAAITAANNSNNSKSNNGEQKWVLGNVNSVIEVNRQAFERLQAKATLQQRQRQQKLAQQQQHELVLSQMMIMSSQNMHAAREQMNADALEEDNANEDEQEWKYPGQYYERTNSKVTFAEVFGEEEEDDRKMPAIRAAGHAVHDNEANENADTSLKVLGEEDDRRMPASRAAYYGTTGNDDNDGDESSLEEFQSAVQELPVESTDTSQVARSPFVQEEEEEESTPIGVTPGRRRTPDDDRRDSLGSSMSTAKTPFRSNKTSTLHQQVPARLLMPVMATMATTRTPTTDISRPEASPVSLHDRGAGTPTPAATESSEPANSPNLLLSPEECSTEDMPFDEDPMEMQSVVNETTPAQDDVPDAPAVDLPVAQECGPTSNANDARVLESDDNNDNAQAASAAEVPAVQECLTTNANDARVLESDDNNDIVQAVAAADAPVAPECPTANANDAHAESDDKSDNNNDNVQAVLAADAPVEECSTVNANDPRVESDNNNDNVQAVSAADAPVEERPTATENADDARVLEIDDNDNNNNDDVQAVSAADVPVESDENNDDANVPTDTDIEEATGRSPEPVARSDAAVAATSSIPSHATTTLAVETPAQQQQFTKSVYAVGTVVQVQARTWPGVNKHGGVAKIASVHTSSDGSVKYNVKYVLGGGEKYLEEIFVSLHIDERGTREADEEEVGASGARKSYRLESKEDSIPPDVLANLKAEGFDVKGVAVPSNTDSGVRRLTKQFTLEHTSGNTKSLNANQRGSKRKLRPAESGPAASKENAMPAAKNAPGRRKPRGTAPVPAKESSQTLNKTVANKRKSAASLGNEKGKKRKTARPSIAASEGIQIAATAAILELTNEQKCESADVLYMDSIRAAMQKGLISVVTSGLSEIDTEALKKLCKGTKKNDVQIKFTESFNSDKTTLCVVSVDPRAGNGGNLFAGKRTLKAMQATMAGVPLLSPAWISSFGDSSQFTVPDSSMFVRTLPAKTTREDQIMDYGVSAIAAVIRSSRVQEATFQFKILTDISVYLCGSFQPTISKLLREAGAEVLTASKTIAKLSADGDPKVILLCSDNDCKIPNSVEKKVKIHKSQVQVVNVDWLFDSISCGSVLTAGAYEPKVKQAKELWAITMDAN